MPETNDQPFGCVVGLAVRPRRGAALQTREQLAITTTHGIEEDHGKASKRGVTLLSQPQWRQTVADLGLDEEALPWTTRRANVLIDAPSLAPLIGQTIRLGEITIAVLGETDPCSMMDRQHAGLRNALEPDCRGGVFGRILTDGAVCVGDALLVVDSGSPMPTAGS